MSNRVFTQDKIKIGIFGFTGCAGDQLVIVHDEDRLLEYFNNADIRSFIMACTAEDRECELDVALVEGSINTEHEIKELKEIRERSKILVAIGTCAVHGGIQAGYVDDVHWKKMYDSIYGKKITLTKALTPKPVSEYVKVDAVIPGCPIDKDQIYAAFSKLVHGVPVEFQKHSVCDVCRNKENICLLNEGKLCMGPITAGGCYAACPSNNVECMGCYGLYEEANVTSFFQKAKEIGFDEESVIRRLMSHGGTTMVAKLKKMRKL